MLVASAWEGVHSHLLACALWIKKFLNKSGMVCANKYYDGGDNYSDKIMIILNGQMDPKYYVDI